MFISPHKIFAPANSDGDPIILSRLDCDIYKFVMGQFIWKEGKADVPVTFGLKIRTVGVRLGKIIPEAALRAQLDSLRSLSFSETELSQLRGMTIDGKREQRHLFELPFITELQSRSLPEYELQYLDDGNINLTFTGPWLSVMFWETAAMAIISELYYWHLWQLYGISPSGFGSFYADLYGRLIRDCEKLARHPGLTFSQFGHRRRHSRMWEVLVQETYSELLPNQCTAPSNVWLGFKMGQNNPKGTNAHEQSMVWATENGNTDEWIKESPYDMVRRWNAYYPELAILLPDTFRTTAFLAGADASIARSSTGVRIDSKIEEQAIPELIEWFQKHGEDPMQKVFIPSDGLTADRMISLYTQFAHLVGVLTFGYGTQATNQINGILKPETGFRTISMVIKAIMANGLPTVKLSDNPNKHTGIDAAEIKRYNRLFLKAGESLQDVVV